VIGFAIGTSAGEVLKIFSIEFPADSAVVNGLFDVMSNVAIELDSVDESESFRELLTVGLVGVIGSTVEAVVVDNIETSTDDGSIYVLIVGIVDSLCIIFEVMMNIFGDDSELIGSIFEFCNVEESKIIDSVAALLDKSIFVGDLV
jgi:uncharacterized membrane protein YeaQ/YmgE (transglycosylase-associated protein family)